ncbi:hypothetical protein [Novosphingobium sp.]|uniref:hypothetical protein n=1 Tax=Novosphingobium sp. TaxID=1874826 RepID=UPI0031D2DCC1
MIGEVVEFFADTLPDLFKALNNIVNGRGKAFWGGCLTIVFLAIGLAVIVFLSR